MFVWALHNKFWMFFDVPGGVPDGSILGQFLLLLLLLLVLVLVLLMLLLLLLLLLFPFLYVLLSLRLDIQKSRTSSPITTVSAEPPPSSPHQVPHLCRVAPQDPVRLHSFFL